MATARPLGLTTAGNLVARPSQQSVGINRFAYTNGTVALPTAAPAAGQALVFDGAGGSSFGAAGGTTTTMPFVTHAASGTLSNERVLTNLNGVTINLATPGQAILSVSTIGMLQYVLHTSVPSLPYSLPTGAVKARFYLQAAGGGGGGSGPGGGGGAGGTVIYDVFPDLATNITITAMTLGTGGAGGVAADGGDGGNSSVTVSGHAPITAYGGGGGAVLGGGGGGGGSGGAATTTTPGVALPTDPTSPDGGANGTPGGPCKSNGFYMGGAGGGDAAAAGGLNYGRWPGGAAGNGGGGGSSFMAQGGTGSTGIGTGLAGQYGSGGGGGDGGFDGGAGGDGCLIIEYVTNT